ncbi:hypothetical protein KC19_8G039000 [Ceratodon purpureus]|uniref:Uncharacterized protein n=1 Tax=Ceratodon purpureus TaxID=3225 RepID=A0A8T0GYK1_CERPU|nr:hypothetical protein KC19_8G039000 [Ceratodon purpureus]
MQFLERVGLMFLKFGSHRGLSGVTKTTTSLVCRNLVLCLEAAEGVLEEYGESRTYCWTEGQPCASAGSTSKWRYDLGQLWGYCSCCSGILSSSCLHRRVSILYIVLARGSTPDLFLCDEPVNDDKGRPKTAITQCEKVLDLRIPEARCTLFKIREHLNHLHYYQRCRYQLRFLRSLSPFTHRWGKRGSPYEDAINLCFAETFCGGQRIRSLRPAGFTAASSSGLWSERDGCQDKRFHSRLVECYLWSYVGEGVLMEW